MRALALTLSLAASSASAFCGFYVSGAGGQLFNDASMVVLLRDGTRTVLSMQNNYKGPTESFALVVPVPVVLSKDNVKTLPREAFTRLDELTSPRLVEQPQDDCRMAIGGFGSGAGMMDLGAAHGMPRDLGVKVEAKFNVEEYEIVILSAELALGLEIWLKENKYKIPDGASALLKPYVQSGSKFFVAKVDAKKAKFVGGELTLSPLRFSYDSEAFTLPVRLGLMNSAGEQDLVVHIIAKSRYELANVPNVLVPTNLDVRTRVRPQFGAFYSELLSRTFKQNPRAAVTEFAWEGALPGPVELQGGGIYGVTCDPCPPPNPVDNPLAKYLGVLSLPKIKTDDGIAAFARAATVTRLHLRYGKDTAPDDLVFKVASPIAGGTPEMKVAGPAKTNRFQGRYVMWVQGCGSGGIGLGGGNAFGGTGPLRGPSAKASKLVDPIEEILVSNVPELELTARPLRRDAPELSVTPDVQSPPPAPRGPTVSEAVKDVTGLERDVVLRVVKRMNGQIRYCYERELTKVPGLRGKLTLKLHLGAEGNVTAVEPVRSDLQPPAPEVDACVAGRARTWTFPKPKGPGPAAFEVGFLMSPN